MKIVSVMTTSSRGGAEFAATELLRALAARDHEVVMLTGESVISRDTQVRVSPLNIGPKLSSGTYPSIALRWLPYLWRLRSALEAEAPYDVLLLHYKKEQLMALCLPTRLRPVVAWCEWGPVPHPMRRGLPRALYLAAARRAAVILAVSEGTRQSLCEVGVSPEQVRVVPNAVRTDTIVFSAPGRARVRRQLGIAPDAFVVGCISRFHPKKRNDVVIDAVARLDGEPHLILAGEGECEDDLRRQARVLGDRVHFMRTPGDELPDLLSAFDVSVFCPSPLEGAPRAVILAMLASRPCLATGSEGVSDVIVPGTGAITATENDPAALAELLRSYVTDPERTAREGAAAREHAESRYTAPAIGAQVEELLCPAGRDGAG